MICLCSPSVRQIDFSMQMEKLMIFMFHFERLVQLGKLKLKSFGAILLGNQHFCDESSKNYHEIKETYEC